MLPPATPTTQLSIERIAVGLPITLIERSSGRPPLTTETLVLVPPTLDDDRVGGADLMEGGGDSRRRARIRP